MRILVTASREWTDVVTLHTALNEVYASWRRSCPQDKEFVVVHGKARGGDMMAHRWAQTAFWWDPRIHPEDHPADWERYGKAAGHIRNQEMVDTGVDRCLGFPLGRSPGTRGCMKIAKKAGVPVKRFSPQLW